MVGGFLNYSLVVVAMNGWRIFKLFIDCSGNEWLEDSLLDWMGNRNFTAEVQSKFLKFLY